MRLAQLARKLSLKPAEVHAFLAERGHVLELNPNTRITDDQVLLAIRHFDPSLEGGLSPEEPTVEGVPDVTDEPEVVETAPSAEIPAEPAALEAADSQALPVEPEIIRAPKAELPGLRVVGKIELKEPRKKEPEPPANDKQPVPERKPTRPYRENKQQRSWKNPLEAERQRQAREREEQRERELELEKQRRTQKYLKKVKSVPTKRVRREDESDVEVIEDVKPAPKTWLGKFGRWLTT